MAPPPGSPEHTFYQRLSNLLQIAHILGHKAVIITNMKTKLLWGMFSEWELGGGGLPDPAREFRESHVHCIESPEVVTESTAQGRWVPRREGSRSVGLVPLGPQHLHGLLAAWNTWLCLKSSTSCCCCCLTRGLRPRHSREYCWLGCPLPVRCPWCAPQVQPPPSTPSSPWPPTSKDHSASTWF